ncbi:hypothetical protein, partial [Candidatus Entotheonella palauensis]|uniref:hypothetical protein n=1 Tax=Candidatus Entotheonella palauensis TaxID=93172 RepID=UPI001C4E24CD
IIIHDENSAFIYHLLLTIYEVRLSDERRLPGTGRRWASYHGPQPALVSTEPFENVGHRAPPGGICYRETEKKAREFAIFNGAAPQA